jgi:hypothetical protein
MVEVIVATLIVGLVLVGAINLLGSAMQTRRINAQRLEGPALAHQLMAEILAMPYEDPDETGGPIGLETGENSVTRADFDDVDDYHNWTAQPPRAKDGTVLIGASRTVTVEYFDPSMMATTGSDSGVKRITVTVSLGTPDEFQLHAIRSRWGGLEQPPQVDIQAVTSLMGQLRLGSQTSGSYLGTNLLNHASDQ